MKSTILALAAAIALLPSYGESTPKDIHAVMAAEEQRAEPSSGQQTAEESTPAKDAALDEEMDGIGDESLDEHDENGKVIPIPYTEEGDAAAGEDASDTEKQPIEVAAPSQTVHGYGYGGEVSRADVFRDAGARADLAQIAPITLKGGDWVFIEGDERRGWFFDRSMMTKNSDGTISYWQLILYNDLGREQFARAMHDEAYEKLGYTLQHRVLNVKERTIRTYDIIAYDGENSVITEGDRDGHAAEIRPNTMAEKEFDAVKRAARKLK